MCAIKLNEENLSYLIRRLVEADNTFVPTFNNNNNQQQSNQPSDVKTLSNVQNKATSVNRAAGKINTTTEFSGAFKNWFQTLGYKPNDSTVSIARVQALVKKSMSELGYK